MPIRYRYHPKRDLLIHIGEGAVSIEEIEALRHMRRSAGVPASVPNTLTDMRRAHFDFDLADLRANEEGKPAEHYAGERHAEIVAASHATAVLMLWRNWLPDSIVVEVFSTPEAAYEWLDVEPFEGDLDF